MTWKEFKAFIEKYGITDRDRISWIACRTDRPIVVVEEPDGAYAVANLIEPGSRLEKG